MATFKIFKLHFTAPFHISDPSADSSVSLKTVHSDTMYSALMSCLAKTGHDIPANGDLGFTLSSLFPFYQKDEQSAAVYFLPMPLQTRIPDLKDVSKAKKVKKVKWVESEQYGTVLSGEHLFDGDSGHMAEINGEYLTSHNVPHDFVRSELSQRVKIESRTGEKDALPYYVDRITFTDRSGFYFLAEGDVELLEKALQILSMEGLGTDRNVGFGFFDYDTDTLQIDTPITSSFVVSLSLFFPESETQLTSLLDSECVAYDFIRRGGWITTYPYHHFRKNVLYGFLPGSVFRLDDANEYQQIGKICDVSPALEGVAKLDHKIWRCGRALTLPIKLDDRL